MKALLYSIVFITSFSLIGQSTNQDESNKKINSKNQAKGGCTISMHDLSLQATLQTSPQTSIHLSWSNRYSGGNALNCYLVLQQTLERQVGTNSYDTLNHFFGDTTYIDTLIVPGLAYNYRLTRRTVVFTNSTYFSYSDTISLQTVGLQEEKNTISAMYPVPAKDFLIFETDQRALGEAYNIINISGQTVKSGIINSNKMKLNVEELPNGFYFLRINEFAKKFVVSN